MSQGILWAVIQAPLLIPPKYPLSSAHHITLQYGVNLEEYKHLLAKEFSATCLYEAWNGRVQCVAVKLPDYIPCTNKYPHITVSWVQGATPVESNSMLASRFNYKLVDLVVDCKIEFFEWQHQV